MKSLARRDFLAAALAAALAVGCYQAPQSATAQLGPDFDSLTHWMSSAGNLEPGQPTLAPNPDLDIPCVSTVASPELPRRPITRAECIALALEGGRTGTFFDRAGGDRQTSALGLQRQTAPASVTDNIRVVAYDPAVLGTEIEQSLSKFDAVLQSSLVWNRVDRPTRDLNPFPTGLEVLGNGDRYDDVQFRTALLKPLPTGGVAGITIRDDYENDKLPPGTTDVLNPANRAAVDLSFEQPLLQGAGVLINQLRDTHPGSILNPFPVASQVPGILLARVAYEESRLEFERRVQELLFAVEEAYWDLYSAYWDLYSRERGVRLAREVWQMAKDRFEAGGINEQELAQIEAQYHLFRASVWGRWAMGPGSWASWRRSAASATSSA